MKNECPACGSATTENNHYATCQNKECPIYQIPVFVIELGRMEDEGGIPQ